MQKANELFSGDDRAGIRDAVAAAERQTAVEIVPVVATSSGRYDRPEDIVGLWLGAGAMLVTYWMRHPRPFDVGGWDRAPWLVESAWLLVPLVVGFLIGAMLADRVDWLRRLFTPEAQMIEEVRARAAQVFFDQRVHHTANATGLLLYVSLFERKALVLADQKIGEDVVARARDCLTRRLKEGLATDGFREAIEAVTPDLARLLPRESGDADELPNALVILD